MCLLTYAKAVKRQALASCTMRTKRKPPELRRRALCPEEASSANSHLCSPVLHARIIVVTVRAWGLGCDATVRRSFGFSPKHCNCASRRALSWDRRCSSRQEGGPAAAWPIFRWSYAGHCARRMSSYIRQVECFDCAHIIVENGKEPQISRTSPFHSSPERNRIHARNRFEEECDGDTLLLLRTTTTTTTWVLHVCMNTSHERSLPLAVAADNCKTMINIPLD